MGGEKMAHNLNRHVIKWCKLFLDESQAVWTMPNREEGFYHAWRGLVQHDPALSHTIRKQLNEICQKSLTMFYWKLYWHSKSLIQRYKTI